MTADRRNESGGGVAGTYRSYASSRRKRRAWDASNPGNRAIRQEVRDHLLAASADQLRGDGRILDVGCGGGYWLRALAAAGVEESRLHGVDLIEDRVVSAARSLPRADLRVADASRLPHPDSYFDLILMFTVLSSLPDRQSVRSALIEAERVTARGGRIIVWEPRVRNPLNRSVRLASFRLLRPLVMDAMEVASVRSLTVAPPLARRLGPMTASLYPRLARLGFLRTHELIVLERIGDRDPP